MKVYRWLWWKKYFDTGLSKTSYAKYLIGFFGIFSIGKDIDINYTIYLGILYFIFCIILGYYWIKWKLQHQENEIDNIINPFQEEVRKSLIRLTEKQKV